MACEHRGCDCKGQDVGDGNRHFCSDFCRKAQMTGQHEDRCRCGHPDCKGSRS
jgi:hypothetical protein